jgi:hypothetical protein
MSYPLGRHGKECGWLKGNLYTPPMHPRQNAPERIKADKYP